MNPIALPTPAVSIHLTAALIALALGPVVLWSRRGQGRIAPGARGGPSPRLHRMLGATWVLMMVIVALSAIFISTPGMPNVAGFSLIHLLVPITLATLWRAFAALRSGQADAHRKAVVRLYIAGCVVAGAFTLAPQRFLGQLVWGRWLGWV